MEIIRLESKLMKIVDKIIKMYFLYSNLFKSFSVTAVNVFGNPCELLHADRIPILIYSLKEEDSKGIFILHRPE